MNAERLHAILIELNQELDNAKTVANLQNLINNLSNVVNQPHPSHQQALSQSLKTMENSLSDAPSDCFSPAWRQILREISGEDFCGQYLKSNIDTILARNQITPAVALDELQQLHVKLQAFKKALENGKKAFEQFRIGNEKLGVGECEIGILIPRVEIKNHLLDFAEELNEIGFILNTFSEVSTGKKDDLIIRTISSSDLLVHLQAAAPYAACVAICVERVVALYKQLLEIRKLHQEIREQGVPDKEMTGIEEYANNLMKGGIEKIAVQVIDEYHKKDDKGRKNELTNAIRICLNKIANRIDRGFNLEVRVSPVKNEENEKQNEELKKAFDAIQSATANMQFMKLEGKPILKLPEAAEKK